VITLDTSGVLAIINRSDPHHVAVRGAFDRSGGPYLISTAVLSEITWFLETRFRQEVEQAFFQDVRREAYMLYWQNQDLDRIEQLMQRYSDLPLGFSDSAVIACAELHGGEVLTTDRNHFLAVARGENSIVVLP
jgi:predicted nucleic acid-binding protein